MQIICFHNPNEENGYLSNWYMSPFAADGIRDLRMSRGLGDVYKRQTYKMLANPELEMWDFSPFGIFDMWEAEQVTGNPRNSLYIRRD